MYIYVSFYVKSIIKYKHFDVKVYHCGVYMYMYDRLIHSSSVIHTCTVVSSFIDCLLCAKAYMYTCTCMYRCTCA